MNKLNIIGLMSGTSLDGLDIVHSEFTIGTSQKIIGFEIIGSKSYNYSELDDDTIREKLMKQMEEIKTKSISFGGK